MSLQVGQGRWGIRYAVECASRQVGRRMPPPSGARSLSGVQQRSVPGNGRTPARVIAVGASAGGLEALRCIVADLPRGLPAAVLVVLHIPATGKSLLAPILDRAGELPARVAAHGDPLIAGTE